MWSVSQGAAGKAEDRGPAAEHQLGLGGSGQARPGAGGGAGGGSICILGFCFLGCLSIRGPKSVRGVERGSLTVQCRYDPGWEAHDKWWCRGELWSICHILVQTTRSGRGTDGERVSISDDRSNRLITVTMTGLRRDDQDVYWCGISKRGTDLGVPIKVSVDPGKNFPAPSREAQVWGLRLHSSQGRGEATESLRTRRYRARAMTDSRGGRRETPGQRGSPPHCRSRHRPRGAPPR